MAGHSHRSSMKNGHKSFKSKHASKGALKRVNKGKVERDVKKNKPLRGAAKLERRNTARQLRQNKILDTLEVRRLFEGKSGAGKVVTVIPLTGDVSTYDIVRRLLAGEGVEAAGEGVDGPLVRDVYVNKFKANLKIVVPEMGDFLHVLDCAKVADYVVFGLSGVSEVDPEVGEQIVRALELQGISSYVGVVTNLSQVHEKEKFQLDVKQSLESYFRHFFPNMDRIYNLEKPTESLNALRHLCQKVPREVSWRDSRGYMVAQKMDYQEGSELGDLVVEGTVRGAGFNVDRLVHVPGFGDFQMNKIQKLVTSTRRKKTAATVEDDPLQALQDELNNEFSATGDRDDLDDYAPENLDMDEWIDEEDFEYDDLTTARYDGHGFLPGREQHAQKKKVPKGTSEYQAKWYLDDDIEADDDEEKGESSDEELGDYQEIDADMDIEVDQDEEDGNLSDNGSENHVELSPEEEERQWQEYKALEKDDLDFPDEIEINPSESAIERLKRYRGLKNLHNCVWNYDEKDPNAPPEWKRVLRVGNYRNTKRKLLKDTKKDAQLIAGDRIRMFISFPKHLLEKLKDPSSHLLAIYSLLPHEHKSTIVNFSIQKWEEYDEPVPSQEPLVVQYGIRRYTIQPLFSSTSNTPNNVHKYENFLHQGSISVATCIAPIDFTQSPAIFFKPNDSKATGLELVGHGSFLNSDHTRIIAKRAVLTGHPFRFHKNVVTVRYMFFSPEDVEWFKSIPLFTKSGRSGFIKESLGTHGYFKATFDAKLSAQDVVGMSLFKRMWPMPSLPWTS